MRRSMRTYFVCLLTAMMMYQPAAACNFCGGWGGGYYAPAYYGPAYGGGYNCGYETVVYDDCDSCGSCSSCEPCGGCGESEAVVTEGAVETIPQPSSTQPIPAQAANPHRNSRQLPNSPRQRIPLRNCRFRPRQQHRRQPSPPRRPSPQIICSRNQQPPRRRRL